MKGTSLYKISGLSGMHHSMIVALILLLAIFSEASAQGFNQKYNVYLFGQLTSEINGAPLKDQKVFIVSDTVSDPEFYYSNVVYTDHEGYYYDTILTTLEKGALIISTYDYQELKHDTTVYYRFKWSESNILFANFLLPTAPMINVNQANFVFERNPTGINNLEYQFYDITDSENILSWKWDFGDGESSDEQNPSHAYAEGGLYKIVLTVEIFSTQNAKPYITSIVKLINVTDQLYFHMGGHVFAGYFPIDKSEVFLYKIEGEELIPIDTAIFNESLGYYLFYQLIEGEYILKADLHPESNLFDMFLTTYYSDKLHWDEADTVFHHSTYYDYDINLVPNTTAAAAGPGTISGEIGYDPGYGGGSKSAPAENISILLYDENGEATNICHSDQNGQFMLDDLDLQMYYVYAEVTGKYTIPVEVVLEESATGNMSLQIIIDDTYVSGVVSPGIHENSLEKGLSEAFPNPADHTINILYSNDQSGILTYSILNYTGQTVLLNQVLVHAGSSSININIGELNSGMYFIRFTDQNKQTATKKFIKN